jgi:S-adenosyl-L-methionine hydrolase (adenosine-forming)
MRIITLTTDFGQQDYYTGALKGALLKACGDVHLIDITHQIKPFDIVQASLVLQNCWREYPEGTLHLAGVNCVYAAGFRFVAVTRGGHWFMAPDNGMLTLLFEDLQPHEVRLLPEAGGHFAVKKVFAEAAVHWMQEEPFDTLGQPAGPLLQRLNWKPVVKPDTIRGAVLHVDHFDNVMVNVRRETFESVGKGRSFSLYFKRNDPITQLSANYCDVPQGEPLCLFNSAGYLEIAVNMGKAATLLSLKAEDVIEIVFES